MRKAFVLLFLILGTLFLSAPSVCAEEDFDDEEPSEEDVEVFEDEDDVPNPEDQYEEAYDEELEEGVAGGPNPYVTTSFIFPDYPDKKLVVGEKATVLVSFTNGADEPFNITDAGAYLHSPFDYTYFIQNFTAKSIGVIVEPQEQVSLEYVFMPDPSLEPLEFWLSAYVRYNNSVGVQFRSTYTNSTITLVEAASSFDAQQFFSFFLLVAIVGLVAYAVLSNTKMGKKAVRSARNASESGTKSSGAEEWGQIYKQAARSRPVGRKNSKKAKKKAQ